MREGFVGTRFSPDGSLLAVSTVRGVAVLDSLSGRERSFLAGPYAPEVAFTPCGDRLATGGSTGTIQLWDTASGQEVLTLTGHKDQIASLHFTRDGRQLVSAGRTGTLRVWDATPLAETKK